MSLPEQGDGGKENSGEYCCIHESNCVSLVGIGIQAQPGGDPLFTISRSHYTNTSDVTGVRRTLFSCLQKGITTAALHNNHAINTSE